MATEYLLELYIALRLLLVIWEEEVEAWNDGMWSWFGDYAGNGHSHAGE